MSSTTSRKRSRSRRKRRAPAPAVRRDALSRGRVIREALALLDRDGLETFSIRRLADHLGVTPMALYNHVNSKKDLLHAVAETLVGAVEYHPTRGDWRRVVAGCFRTLREACLAHPGAVPLVESADMLPAAVFRPMEIVLSALQSAGLTRDEATRAYFVLITFTLGQVKYQMGGWARGVDLDEALREGRIDAAAYPAVAQVSTGQAWDFDTFFEFGLSVIVAGLHDRARKR
jgi:TetR/AcrR family tetracycline transcriptional repressor